VTDGAKPSSHPIKTEAKPPPAKLGGGVVWYDLLCSPAHTDLQKKQVQGLQYLIKNYLIAQASAPTDALHVLAAKREHDHCNGLPSPHFVPSGTPHFRKRFQLSGRRCQPPTLFLQLSHGFGRITNEIKPYLPNLPLSSVFLPVPPDAICRETPQLDRGYCNVMRYCLNSQASHSGFP